MKLKNFILLFFLFCFGAKSQDSLQTKPNRHQIGIDIYNLACGDTADDYYLKNQEFTFSKNTEWKETNFGFSLHYYYNFKFISIGARFGLINNASLYHAWEEEKGSTIWIEDKNLVIRHSKLFIAPIIKFEKKIKKINIGASFELPVTFNDKIQTENISHIEDWINPIKDTLFLKFDETWNETIKNGVSFGVGLGVFASANVSKKIQIELSLNKYYFVTNTVQKFERNGNFKGQIMNLGTNYSYYDNTYLTKKENNLNSQQFSRLSIKLSVNYNF